MVQLRNVLLSVLLPFFFLTQAIAHDFSSDGKSDLVWRNYSTGDNSVWLMDGTEPKTFVTFQSVPDLNWYIEGSADFDGDGKPDLLWRNYKTGDNSIWLMNGTTPTKFLTIQNVPDLNWHMAGTGDFNGDGKPDILWRNYKTGDNSIWLMGGTTPTNFLTIQNVADINWHMAGSGDFDGDGKADILWRNYSTGENSIWLMDGITPKSFVTILRLPDTNWQMAGGDDFDGDGKADILWRNPKTGQVAIWVMDGTNFVKSIVMQTTVGDQNWKIAPTSQTPVSKKNKPVPPIVVEVMPAALELLKIDPDPVLVNTSFSVVVRVTNNRNSQLSISLNAVTSSPSHDVQLTLNPNEARIVELTSLFNSAGDHDVEVTGRWQTDQTILVPKGPTDIQRIPVFKALTSAWGTVQVLASLADRPQLVDFGPNQPDEVRGKPAATGVVGALAGSSGLLFAIPKTGGVWRSANGGPWVYLANSPPRAFSIAVDLSNPNHIVVGERPDDNPDPLLGRSGVWESADSGNTWRYTFDPAPTAGSQGVPAVAISRVNSTVFAATSGGVVLRETGQTSDSLAGTFMNGFLNKADPACNATDDHTPLGNVTSVVTSETRVWARSATTIFWSDTDKGGKLGRVWNCAALPPKATFADGSSQSTSYVNAQGVIPRPDTQSFAAVDDWAYLIFKAGSSSTTALLIFNPATRTFAGQSTGDNDGRGLGGIRFVRAYALDRRYCPLVNVQGGPGPVLGGIGIGRQVLIGHAQSVQQATGVADATGRLNFDQPLGTTGAGDPLLHWGVQPNNPDIHADIWDFLLPMDYCPGKTNIAYEANDGGVYMGDGTSNGGNTPRIFGMNWKTRSDGLRAHTAQSLSIVVPDILPPQVSLPGSKPTLPVTGAIYPTQDDESWWLKSDGTWESSTNQGDSNYIVGDQSFDTASSWRQFDGDDGKPQATLFSGNDSPTNFAMNTDTSGVPQTLGGSDVIQAVQTAKGEVATGLDVVMLVDLPLPNSNHDPVSDPQGGTGKGKRQALIRNTKFDSSADGPGSGWSNWTIVNDAIPAGAKKLWVSGGHDPSNTTYFLYTDTNPSCPQGVERLDPGQGSWNCILKNLIGQTTGIGFTALQGPVYINPYDPQMLIFVSGTSSQLMMTLDGARTPPCPLPSLQALITESGRYGMSAIDPQVGFISVNGAFHGYPPAIPSHVSFNRQNPSQILVASPYTGLYLGSVARFAKSKVCAESWRDLTPYIPAARAYVTGTAFAGAGAVFSSQGRGIYGLTRIATALPATLFVLSSAASASNPVAVLNRADRSPLSWGRVAITLHQKDATNALIMNGEVTRSDDAGKIFLPLSVPPGEYIMDLKFLGDGSQSSSISKSYLTIN